MPRRAILLVLLAACSSPEPAPERPAPAAPEPAPPRHPVPVPEDPRVRVTLSAPAEHDPLTEGEGRLTVVIENASREPVVVSGGDAVPERLHRVGPWPSFVLHGQGAGHRWPSSLWRRERDPATDSFQLAPGARVVALDLALRDVLPPRAADAPAGSAWVWHWPAHPEPPQSPLARWREPGYEESATLWALVVTDRGVARSPDVTVRLARR